MVGVLVRAVGPMALAPLTPVAWWPGARALPDSVLRRLPRALGRIAIPVEGRRPATARGSTPSEPERTTMIAPWGEPVVPFAGVTVSTHQVPVSWLRPAPTVGRTIRIPVMRGQAPVPFSAAGPATITEFPRAPRTVPQAPAVGYRGPIGRFRRAAALALGLLVSLIAVEAAARSGRR